MTTATTSNREPAQLAADIAQEAKRLCTAGISVIPIDPRTKKPDCEILKCCYGSAGWKQFQSEIVSEAMIDRWASLGMKAFASVCGAISDNREVIDFDEPGFYEAWRRAVGNLADNVVVQERGDHQQVIYCRTDPPKGNTKLAHIPDENAEDGRRVGAETRGEGGYAVVAPSFHPSGTRYVIVQGDTAHPPVLAPAHADALLEAARKLDQAPFTRKQIERIEAEARKKYQKYQHRNGQASVIDAFNKAHSIEAILEQHGYTLAYAGRFVRPGGKSASLSVKDGRSCHFSSNDQLNDGKHVSGCGVHDAFSIYAELEHNGDVPKAVKAAAEALGMDTKGYNNRERTKKPKRIIETDKPKIETGRQLGEMANDSLRALSQSNNPPRLYVRHGQLSRIAVDEQQRRSIVTLNEAALRGELARSATFFEMNQFGEGDRNPPAEVVKDILSRDVNEELRTLGAKLFPGLTAITETPVLRMDGTIIVNRGYDATTGIVYEPPPGEAVPEIPERPTPQDNDAARDLLNELVCDFPFETGADKANFFGELMTPAIRHAVPRVPIAANDAPQLGSGKSLLADIVSVIHTGREANMSSYPETDDELRKMATSLLMAGSQIIVFDNCDGTIAHPTLARLVTATIWQDRRLGTNLTATCENRATIIATGNNMTFGGDLIRRIYRCRINCESSRPWQGRTFKHPRLIEWVRENRPRLAAAILIMLRSWWAAGRPDLGAKKLGSFEDWSYIVGNALSFGGINGFLGNLDNLYDSADDEGPVWEKFLAAWHGRFGSKPITLSVLEESIPDAQEIRDTLPDPFGSFIQHRAAAWPSSSEVFYLTDAGRFKQRLGKALKARIDKRYGEQAFHIHRETDSHHGVACWAVQTKNGGSAGSGGSVPTQYVCDPSTRTHTHAHTRTHVKAETTPATPALPANHADEEFDRREREAVAQEGM